MTNTRKLVLGIHETPQKLVLAVTGGGAEVIGDLLKYGGGSATLLEAVVPYDQNAFDSFIRGTPDKYCSPQAARDLAMAAYQRAKSLSKQDPLILGVGVSCSLAKDNEREGRKHHAYVAVQTFNRTTTYDLTLDDIPNLTSHDSTREAQERHVADFVLCTIADQCGLLCTLPGYYRQEHTTAPLDLARVVMGVDNIRPFKADLENRVLFPGSFNPMHEQHKKIAEFAHKMTGKKVDLEVCVHNVDKPAINYTELCDREAKLLNVIRENPWGGELFFTGLPTFMQKALHFKNATFLVGLDTFVRINDSRYHNIKEVLDTFEAQNINFLVFDRLINGKSSYNEIGGRIYPQQIMSRTTVIGPDLLPPVEMASSTIRKNQ